MSKEKPTAGESTQNGPANAEAPKPVAPIVPVAERDWETDEPPMSNGNLMRSVDLRRFMTAFALAEGEIKNAKKSKKNTHFKSSYADLVEVTDAIRDALSRHLIAWIQIPVITETEILLETTLTHGPSGQYVTGHYPISNSLRGKNQELVAAFTYARRASLSMMCGVAPEEEDDDGETIEGRGPEAGQDQPDRGGRDSQTKSVNARKAEEWGDYAAGRKVPSLKTADELVKWEEDNNANLADLKKLAPEHHVKVKAALDAAGARLGLSKAGE